MINYKKINIDFLDDNVIDDIYSDLLSNKWQFVILNINGELNVLTKEKSLFKIYDEQQFLNSADEDIYYKTIIMKKQENLKFEDIKLYYDYIEKFKNKLQKNLYGGKYLFGCISVKTTNGFITSIRGKENLKDYTIVYNVNHSKHLVEVANKKATLNAPLLHYLFENNKNIKVIVHFNGEFDNSLLTLEYAFPGTEKDSIRNVNKSFNVKHHGVFYLFDKKQELI